MTMGPFVVSSCTRDWAGAVAAAVRASSINSVSTGPILTILQLVKGLVRLVDLLPPALVFGGDRRVALAFLERGLAQQVPIALEAVRVEPPRLDRLEHRAARLAGVR